MKRHTIFEMVTVLAAVMLCSCAGTESAPEVQTVTSTVPSTATASTTVSEEVITTSTTAEAETVSAEAETVAETVRLFDIDIPIDEVEVDLRFDADTDISGIVRLDKTRAVTIEGNRNNPIHLTGTECLAELDELHTLCILYCTLDDLSFLEELDNLEYLQLYKCEILNETKTVKQSVDRYFKIDGLYNS